MRYEPPEHDDTGEAFYNAGNGVKVSINSDTRRRVWLRGTSVSSTGPICVLVSQFQLQRQATPANMKSIRKASEDEGFTHT